MAYPRDRYYRSERRTKPGPDRTAVIPSRGMKGIKTECRYTEDRRIPPGSVSYLGKTNRPSDRSKRESSNPDTAVEHTY